MKAMKAFSPALLTAVAFAAAACSSTASNGPEAASVQWTAAGGPGDWDALLHKYVKGEFVDYAGWKANGEDMSRLDAFLKWQGDADVKSMSREEKIAFYTNAYNALCIKVCLDHYPLHSPLDVDGFFDKDKHQFKVGGEMLSASAVEYDRLVPLGDMRAHFAIVCSDRGCPPLWNTAYSGASIDTELEAAARRFCADKRNLVVDPAKKEVQISKLFEWYGKDFISDPQRPAKKPELYLLSWTDGDAKSVLASGGYAVKIIEWNWTLNEKR